MQKKLLRQKAKNIWIPYNNNKNSNNNNNNSNNNSSNSNNDNNDNNSNNDDNNDNNNSNNNNNNNNDNNNNGTNYHAPHTSGGCLSLDISFEGPGHYGLQANKMTKTLIKVRYWNEFTLPWH